MRVGSLLITAIVLSLLLFSPSPAQAEVRTGDEIVISKDEIIDDDLYVFGQNVTVNGTIQGDLIVFGQQININGSVEGDLLAAGQQIMVSGIVADDARIGGQVLTLQDGSDIGDDLIAASYSLECTKASRVQGEVKFAGYQSVLAGRFEKKVKLASANCKLSGSFGDDVEATVDGDSNTAMAYWGPEYQAIPQGLSITESAEIAGDLDYQSKSEAAISPESTIAGEVQHTRIASDQGEPETVLDQAIAFAKQFFALLVVGLLVVYVCPKWTGQVVNNVGRRPLASLGWGALSMIGVIAGAILLLAVTIAVAVFLGMVSLDNLIWSCLGVGGLTIAVTLVGFSIFSTWVAKIIVSVWAGNRIINGPDWTPKQRYLGVALGVLILAALTWIPTVGGVVGMVAMVMGVGSTTLGLVSKRAPMGTEVLPEKMPVKQAA